MSEPLCKIARENGGTVPLDCLFGCKRGCHLARPPMRLAKTDLTCRSCGAPCYWQEVFDKTGTPRVRLFENGKPHFCTPTAGGFEIV